MKSILFKPDMIQAIVEGRKTQTRRLHGLKKINKEPNKWVVTLISPLEGYAWFDYGYHSGTELKAHSRYKKGETVYIKESWAIGAWTNKEVANIIYKDGTIRVGLPWNEWLDREWNKPNWDRWHSPLFMPEWAARYFIKILDLKALLQRGWWFFQQSFNIRSILEARVGLFE